MASASLPRRSAGYVRSPIPLLMGGIIVALLLVLIVALPARQPATDPTTLTTYTEQEALTVVAEKMRSGDAARQVVGQGHAQFDQGAWRISVGDAQFHFTARNRIVVADNDAAMALMYRDPGR